MLPVAKIIKSNGTSGDVLIGLLDCELSDLTNEEPVYIEFDGLPVPFFVEIISPKGSTRAIVHLTDVDSLQDAEELVGREICIDAEYEDDSLEDFTGWTLFDGSRLIGTVDGLEDIPGNPCLIVGGALIPLHEDLISSADPETRTLVMNLPEGLI
ncbi:MAG: hypothetical protein J6S97_05065 [Bacteroidales bacterium]|nr:hypothetical protein [Bacteroidales bacterium]